MFHMLDNSIFNLVLNPHHDRHRPHKREIFRMRRYRDHYLVFNVSLPPSEFYDRNVVGPFGPFRKIIDILNNDIDELFFFSVGVYKADKALEAEPLSDL